VHLRRALLLFAMVLGFAALAAAVSRTSRLDRTDRGAAPSPPPSGEVRPPEEVELSAKGRPRTARVTADDSTLLSASVDEPGQVEVEGLGLLAAADSSTPATLPLSAQPGRYSVLFTPSRDGEPRRIGTLVVKR
jgi:hypothetical protein